MKTLNQVKVGETVKVTKIAGEGPIKRRSGGQRRSEQDCFKAAGC